MSSGTLSSYGNVRFPFPNAREKGRSRQRKRRETSSYICSQDVRLPGCSSPKMFINRGAAKRQASPRCPWDAFSGSVLATPPVGFPILGVKKSVQGQNAPRPFRVRASLPKRRHEQCRHADLSRVRSRPH